MVAEQHESFNRPDNPDVKIWRYMNLAKFLWMLQHAALYFSRSDHLGDPFEGHYTLANSREEDEFVATQMKDPEFAKFGEERHRQNFKSILSASQYMKTLLFVNCWHMNEHESLAMWKLYATHQDSVCIQSRCSRLVQLLPGDAFVGTVKYIDYNSQRIDWGNALEYIAHKRLSFYHERELRAVLWKASMTRKYKKVGEVGLIVPADVNYLIENIYVNPNADGLLVDVLEGLRSSYGLTAPILKSDVNAGPTY
jgi:hypothetical protein